MRARQPSTFIAVLHWSTAAGRIAALLLASLALAFGCVRAGLPLAEKASSLLIPRDRPSKYVGKAVAGC